MCFFNRRSFLWGPAAVEHHKTRKSLGASLWQQASSDDLLALLKPDRMLQTIARFPQQRRIILQVNISAPINFPEQHCYLKWSVHPIHKKYIFSQIPLVMSSHAGSFCFKHSEEIVSYVVFNSLITTETHLHCDRVAR